jgi:predicted metal-dependent hydrolase
MDEPECIFASNHQVFDCFGIIDKRIEPESDDSVARDGSFAIVKRVSHFTAVVAIGICMFGQRILVRICMYHLFEKNGHKAASYLVMARQVYIRFSRVQRFPVKTIYPLFSFIECPNPLMKKVSKSGNALNRGRISGDHNTGSFY